MGDFLDDLLLWDDRAREGICLRKQKFKNRGAAMKSLNALARANMGKPGAKGLSAYRCPFCNKFHIGHRRRVREGRRKK